jgi:hypothetical protein
MSVSANTKVSALDDMRQLMSSNGSFTAAFEKWLSGFLIKNNQFHSCHTISVDNSSVKRFGVIHRSLQFLTSNHVEIHEHVSGKFTYCRYMFCRQIGKFDLNSIKLKRVGNERPPKSIV